METLTLLERCQREARLKMWSFLDDKNQMDMDAVCQFEKALDTLIANTLKQAAEALEGLKTEEPLYVGKTQYEFYKGDIRWVANHALTDAQKLLRGELDNEQLYD